MGKNPITPELLQEQHDAITHAITELLCDESDLSVMAEQHLLMSLDLLAAGTRSLMLAKYHLMRGL